MNNCKMTCPKLQNAFYYFLLVPTLSILAFACSNENQNIDDIEKQVDSIEVLKEDIVQIELPINDSIEIVPRELTKTQLDSIKSSFQKKFDTGKGMLVTAIEENAYLTKRKNEYKEWLNQNCTEGYLNYSNEIDKWETSIQTAMDEEEKELKKEYGEDDWGNDMDMIIFGAGSHQLYLYLEDLIASSKDWCE